MTPKKQRGRGKMLSEKTLLNSSIFEYNINLNIFKSFNFNYLIEFPLTLKNIPYNLFLRKICGRVEKISQMISQSEVF
jgi:hypothetical protein